MFVAQFEIFSLVCFELCVQSCSVYSYSLLQIMLLHSCKNTPVKFERFYVHQYASTRFPCMNFVEDSPHLRNKKNSPSSRTSYSNTPVFHTPDHFPTITAPCMGITDGLTQTGGFCEHQLMMAWPTVRKGWLSEEKKWTHCLSDHGGHKCSKPGVTTCYGV